MTIASLNDLFGSQRQTIEFGRTASIASGISLAAGYWTSLRTLAGSPAAGNAHAVVASAAGAANHAIPNDSTTGFPPIIDFAGGAIGYLHKISAYNSVACRLAINDILWWAGAFNANHGAITFSTPVDIPSTRMPNGAWSGNEIWVEVAATTMAAQTTVSVTYTDESGNAGSVATVVIPANTGVGRRFKANLAAGDLGVKRVTAISQSGGTTGTYNVMVLRPIWKGNIKSANDAIDHGYHNTGMPEIYQDSAVDVSFFPIGGVTATGTPDIQFGIASK